LKAKEAQVQTPSGLVMWWHVWLVAAVGVLCLGSPWAGAAQDATDAASAGGLLASKGYRAQRQRTQASYVGAVGGLRVIDAGGGAVGTFGMSLSFDTYARASWPRDQDLSHFGGSFAWTWTPINHLEVYAFTTRWDSASSELPRDFQVIGNMTLGLKGFYPLTDWLVLGLDAGVSLPLNTLLTTARVMESVGFGPRLSLSADLRNIRDDMDGPPVVLRLNGCYWFENQAALLQDLEQRRYDALPLSGADAPAPGERRHRATPEERLALMIDRVDRVELGVGVEVPLEWASIGTFISPMLEWTLHIPVNRQGIACAEAAGLEPCLSDVGARAWRQRALAGVRVLPPLPGLTLHAAFELGLSGVNTFAYELYPQAPYMVLFGLGYVYDKAR
jgi:hypothetical protein